MKDDRTQIWVTEYQRKLIANSAARLEAAQRLAERAEALLYIFDRDLPEGSIGKIRCKHLRAALAEWEAVK